MAIVACVAVPHPPIILPEVGKGDEKAIQKTTDAFVQAMRFVAAAQPEAIVLISPHATLYGDWFHISPGKGASGSMARFGAPQVWVQVDYDTQLVAAIEAEARQRGIAAGTDGEREPALDHASVIPLVFLQKEMPLVPVVRVGLSGLPASEHYRLGQAIAAAAEKTGRRVAVIASGDLSHRLKEDGPYGYVPEGPQLDEEITRAMAAGDFGALLSIDPVLADKGAECGLRSFVIMAGALDGRKVEAQLLSYEGTFGVGYAVASFRPGAPDKTRHFLARYEAAGRQEAEKQRAGEDAYVALARRSIHEYLRAGRAGALPEDLPAELTGRRAGVFVSLHKFGELRGCIGTIAPATGSVAQEIWRNAVSAAAEDPRFPPVAQSEEEYLSIHVDVLGPAEGIDSEEQLDVKKYGVIVSAGARRGLLLPDLDGVDTVAQQVEIARRKAGIPEDAAVQLERFEVVRHE